MKKKTHTYNVRFVNNKGETTIAFIFDFESATLHTFNGKTYPKRAKWKTLGKKVVEHMINDIKKSQFTKNVVEHI